MAKIHYIVVDNNEVIFDILAENAVDAYKQKEALFDLEKNCLYRHTLPRPELFVRVAVENIKPEDLDG